MNRTVLTSFTILCLLSTVFLSGLAFEIQSVKAASETIYIRADGTIDPTTAPISSIDNITYTFTGNIYESIVIQRDNIVLEGSGYTLQGSGSGNGIDLTSTYNVTIKNANIMGFYYGVYLHHSSNNVVLSNNMTENGWAGVELDYSSNNVISINNMVANNYGIDLNHSVNNTISENEIERSEGMYAIGIRVATSNDINISGNNITANNNDGIWLLYSSNNIIIGNNITANKHDGVELDYSTNNSIIRNNITVNGVYGVLLNDISSNNVVSGNNIKRNMFGIGLSDSSNNSISVNNITANENGVFLFGFSGSSNNSIFVNNITANTNVGIKLYNSLRNIIFHNNFVNNQDHVFFVNESCINVWDDGYPSGGNYWSDYTGIDVNNGPYQNETGYDWIGDSPYIIDSNNTDRYPLMYPFVPEMEEIRIAYRNLLLKYDELQEQTDLLNSTCKNLQESISNLISTFNSTRDNLQEQQKALSNQVNTIQNALYVLAAPIVILIVAIVYVAIRKPRTETKTEKETEAQ